MKTTEEKKQHAREADRIFEQPAVRITLSSFARNLALTGIRPTELEFIISELYRLVSVTAQAARALALGIDPAEFQVTPEEAEAQIAALRPMYEKAGRKLSFWYFHPRETPDGGGRGDD